MTDAFESEVQKFVSRQNGGDLTPQIVYEMLKAVDRDGEARHEETKALLEAHCAEASVRDERIAALEEWRHEQATTCERRVRDLIESEHESRHGAHMAADHPHDARRADDPEDADFSERRKGDEEIGDIRRAWRVARWAVAAFVLPIIATAGYYVGRIIFG